MLSCLFALYLNRKTSYIFWKEEGKGMKGTKERRKVEAIMIGRTNERNGKEMPEKRWKVIKIRRQRNGSKWMKERNHSLLNCNGLFTLAI
jgi:hypothetical protein